MYVFWGPLLFTPSAVDPSPATRETCHRLGFGFCGENSFECFFAAMLLALAPAEANLATCAPREPPATGRCCYGFPAPSALQGCFLNLPTEAFDEAFSSGGLLTTEPCATVTTMPCPTPRPAVRRRRWRSTRPRTSSTSRRQRCAYLPPDLCPSALLTGAMPRSGAVLVGL